ncbi:DUF3298 and DUF4163 domain-containing protein [Tsuneonella sp. CC-YZS046]|uniref:DUF3298 and DUF4163 domain-containing protein n=1 Tax=Tsuneonella sp. CC-YZS046 TaxID=3042152 RepID=UPI002D77DC0F|nr:DUF3298 and DUF4163 domain-containing protein [Tsuneonella sp. CC-YZS046]WRO66927.1 DUF3298 and DUF4163 domain-containing protein [Tsuneonella sp. CC-YZS046]
MPQRIDLREGKSYHARLWLAVAGALMLASCGTDSGADVADDASPAVGATAAAASGDVDATAKASAGAGGARKVDEENELFSFVYSYPAAAGDIPRLKASLDARLEEERGKLDKDARQFKQEAAADGFPYRAYANQTDWAVVADLPGWLSLSAEKYSYTGGAHGMTVFDSLLWDRQAQVERAPLSLFLSRDALEAAIKPAFCEELDRQRVKKRGVEFDRANPGMFDECIGLASTTVLLGSANRKTFDRVGFLIPPYEAGPYAEGAYEVILPVSEAILRAVKPEFRGSFTVSR